jgi:hypothetical protein
MKLIFPTIMSGVFLSFALLVLTGCSKTQEAQKPAAETLAGTRIALTPPPGFTPATQFSGYQLESLGASIMINEIPGPFAEISAAFSNPSELSKKGMSLVEKQEVKSNGRDGLLVKTGQSANGVEYLKWHLVIGDEKETVIITATFPKQSEDKLSEPMKASLLTAVWDRNKAVSPTEGVNYTVDEIGDLKVVRKVSNSLVFTKNGIFPSKDPAEPLFVVAQSISKTAIPDNEQYAKARVLQISQVKEVEIEKTGQITVDNLEGYEIEAKGKDSKSGQPTVVYQVMLFEEQSYYLMQGLAGEQNRQPSLEAFKAMARTFKRRRQ